MKVFYLSKFMSDTDLIESLKSKLAWQQSENARLTEELNAAIAERDMEIRRGDNMVLEFARCRKERDQLRQRVGELETGMEVAWGVIANASKGNWHHEAEDWQDAAADWRDSHWHKMISTKGGDEPCASKQHPPSIPSIVDAASATDASNPPPTSEPEAGETPETDARAFSGQAEWAEDNAPLLDCVEAEFARTLEKHLRHIAHTYCGVAIGEDGTTLEMVAAFVEGQIDKQSDRADSAEVERDAALARVEELEGVKAPDLDADMNGYQDELFQLRARHASDAKEIAELRAELTQFKTGWEKEVIAAKDTLHELRIRRDEVDELKTRADRAEAACAAMREAIEKQLPINKEVNKLPVGNFYLPETMNGFLGALATNSGKALLDRLAAAEADTKRLDWLEQNVISKNPRFESDVYATWNADKTLREAIDSAIKSSHVE